MAKLSARKVASAKAGRHGDGQGLYLVVAQSDGRKWVFRFTFAGKVTEMGLGSAEVVSLSEARDKAHEARRLLSAGQNPIEARRLAVMASTGKPTFGSVADDLISSKEGGWRNQKHRDQWQSSLATYAAPLRPRPVDEVDTEAVLTVLKPIWTAKPETANRVRNRIELVLNAAKAKGLRSGDNPATWRGHLDQLLAKRPKASARGHFKAMPYEEAPAFFARLQSRSTMASWALEFCILTGARSKEVLGLRWAEIDLTAKIWTLPAPRTKAEREHRVPLSAPAIAILEKAREISTGEYVFPSPRGDRPLSHIAMQKVLARMNITNATVHGFRSTFRDWAGDATLFQREVAEAALSHKVGDAAEQAYRRGDALEKRRALMEAWANYCESVEKGNVIPLRHASATNRSNGS